MQVRVKAGRNTQLIPPCFSSGVFARIFVTPFPQTRPRRSDTLPRTWLRGYDRRGRSLVISIGGAGERVTASDRGNNEGGRAQGRLRGSHASDRTHVRRAEKRSRGEPAPRSDAASWAGIAGRSRRDGIRLAGTRQPAKWNPAVRSYAKILSRYFTARRATSYRKPRWFHDLANVTIWQFPRRMSEVTHLHMILSFFIIIILLY